MKNIPKVYQTNFRINKCPNCKEIVVSHLYKAIRFENVFIIIGFCNCGNIFNDKKIRWAGDIEK